MMEHQGTHKRALDGGYIRPFMCSVVGCGKSFTEKRNLNVHRRTAHTEVRAVGYRTRESGAFLGRGGPAWVKEGPGFESHQDVAGSSGLLHRA